MEKRLLMIVNPAAGMGRGDTIKDEIAHMYERYHWQCVTRLTKGAGDAARFARDRPAAGPKTARKPRFRGTGRRFSRFASAGNRSRWEIPGVSRAFPRTRTHGKPRGIPRLPRTPTPRSKTRRRTAAPRIAPRRNPGRHPGR